MKGLSAFCLLLIFSASALAEDVGILLPNIVKSYTVTTDGKGGAVIVPLVGLVKVGQPNPNPVPVPLPVPPPGNPTVFETQIQKLTQAALDKGGTKTTGAGLSEIYSRTAAGVADGSIPLDKSYTAIRDTTKALLAIQGEADKWAAWDEAIDESITIWRAQGKPAAHFVTVYREVASGSNRATGYKGNAAAYPAEKGIFDGINIEQIIKLIELIMKLLTLFGK